jgi:hypothetical protein
MTFTEILADARRFVGADSTSYTTADVTVSANRALDRVVTLIRESEGRWKWDDSNNTDLPIATTSLVADQQDYNLDPTHYQIERIEVKDEDDNWNLLTPIDLQDVFDQSLTDFLKTAGTPKYYDKVGNSIFLYPKPSYSQAASLKVYYTRGPSYFTTSDTTKAPGFNTIFHQLISLWAAYDYALINQMPVQKGIADEIALKEDKLKEYYSLRSKDEHIRLAVRLERYR